MSNINKRTYESILKHIWRTAQDKHFGLTECDRWVTVSDMLYSLHIQYTVMATECRAQHTVMATECRAQRDRDTMSERVEDVALLIHIAHHHATPPIALEQAA